MKTSVLFFLLLFLIPANSFAQNYLFSVYRFECSELFDITFKRPKGFKVVAGGGWVPFKVDEKKRPGMVYELALQSKNKDCLILYPWFRATMSIGDGAVRSDVYAELKVALGLNADDEALELDTVKYIQTFTSKDSTNHFNADTVFICKYPLITPYTFVEYTHHLKGEYNYCIGIYIIKTGHPPAMMKILLTEEGKAKEEEYMQLVFNSMHYSDIAPPDYDVIIWDKVQKRSKAKYMLRHKWNELFNGKTDYFMWK